jgi:nuclear GTP-binding protein
MVAKKHKSKRMDAAQKYKIVKRASEKHRKDRKEAKKNPNKRKALKKDPGIPNMFPFKEKLLQRAAESKAKAALEKQGNKANRAGMSADQSSLAQMAADAHRRSVAHLINQGPLDSSFEGKFVEDAATSGRKDNSRKAYYREFKKVVEQADVILEILDARDPLGCRTKQIEEMILNAGADKRIILILNKIDLVPRETVEAWLKYLRNEYPTVAFKASTQTQRTNLGQSTVPTQSATDAHLNGSECLGADNLIKLLKNYSRNNSIKTSITVGVVGFPNVPTFNSGR